MKKLLTYILLFIAVGGYGQGLLFENFKQTAFEDTIIARYLFDGNFNDSYNSYDLDNYGVTFTTDEDGNPNSAALFVRSESDYLEYPDSTIFRYVADSALTISFKFKQNTQTGVQVLVGKYVGATNQNEYIIYINGSTLTFGALGAGALITTTVSAGVWYKVDYVLSNSNPTTGVVEAFLDDVSIGTVGGRTQYTANPNQRFRIGQTNNSFFYDGVIDSLIIYNKAIK